MHFIPYFEIYFNDWNYEEAKLMHQDSTSEELIKAKNTYDKDIKLLRKTEPEIKKVVNTSINTFLDNENIQQAIYRLYKEQHFIAKRSATDNPVLYISLKESSVIRMTNIYSAIALSAAVTAFSLLAPALSQRFHWYEIGIQFADKDAFDKFEASLANLPNIT